MKKKSQKKLPRLNHTEGKESLKKNEKRTSLVVQWLRTHLPMQGTLVRFLQGNQALALLSPSQSPTARAPQQEKP